MRLPCCRINSAGRVIKGDHHTNTRIARRHRHIRLTHCFKIAVCRGFLAYGSPVPLADPEQLLFVLTDSLLPTVLGTILLAAVLSAIMSTADSQLLVSASAIAHDIMGEAAERKNQTIKMAMSGILRGRQSLANR